MCIKMSKTLFEIKATFRRTMSASGFRQPAAARCGDRTEACRFQAFHQMAPGYRSAQALVTAEIARRRASSPECFAADEPIDDDAPDDDWDEEEELLPLERDDPLLVGLSSAPSWMTTSPTPSRATFGRKKRNSKQ